MRADDDGSGVPPALRRPRWLRPVAGVLGMALVALSLYYLGNSLANGLRQVPLRSLHPKAGPVIVSFVLTVLCVGLGGWAWRLVLLALGYPLPLRRCVAVQTTSNLAKYVPGYAWQLLGKGYLTCREGVPTGVVAWAVLLEMGALLLTGLAVAASAMPAGLALPGIVTLTTGVQAGVAALCWLGVALLPVALQRVGAAQRRPRWIVPLLSRGALWSALGVQVLSWVLFGIAFGCLVRAFQPLSPQDWLLSVFSLVTSFLVSLLALFVPAGLGVRESVMAATLGARLGGGLPVVVAVLSRLALALSELVGFALARLWLLAARDNVSITRKG